MKPGGGDACIHYAAGVFINNAQVLVGKMHHCGGFK